MDGCRRRRHHRPFVVEIIAVVDFAWQSRKYVLVTLKAAESLDERKGPKRLLLVPCVAVYARSCSSAADLANPKVFSGRDKRGCGR